MQSVSDLLLHECARLPLLGPYPDGFRTEYSRRCSAYESILASCATSSDPILRQASTRIELVHDAGLYIGVALAAALDGAVDDAATAIESAMELLGPYVLDFATQPVGPDVPGVLYRLRTDSQPCTINATGLRHIPFECREKIGPQRYSIAGRPSLYLAKTSYLAWTELQRPQLGRVVGNAWRFRRPLRSRVLSLAYTPHTMAVFWGMSRSAGGSHFSNPENAAKKIDQLCLSTIAAWPLLAAVSARAYECSGPPTPEHLIPQLLMNWVSRSSDVVGIRYFSTRISETILVPYSTNWVLPTRSQPATGHCQELLKLFDEGDAVVLNDVVSRRVRNRLPSQLPSLDDGFKTDLVYRQSCFHAFDRAMSASLPPQDVLSST